MRVNRDLVVGIVFGILGTILVHGRVSTPVAAAQHERDEAGLADNAELARLYEEDQGDRAPSGGQPIDWRVVGPRDRQRESRVKALYESATIRTRKDYYRSAMVLQHASKPEDYLLAHEFCVVALAKGEKSARWLAAAATEDRYLMNLKFPQRFGTQYSSTGPNQPVRLYEVAPNVTDALRQELGVPTLAEARRREAEMNRP